MKKFFILALCLSISSLVRADGIELTATPTMGGCTVGVSLSASQEYSGFQVDIITEGAFTLASARLVPQYSAFDFSVRRLESGNVRLLAYTDGAYTFSAGTSPLLTIDMEGDGEGVLKLRNVRFTKADGTEVVMPNATVTVSVAPPPTYTVSFFIDGVLFSFSELTEGEPIVAPDVPEREGYTFGGWNDFPETMPAHDVDVYGEYGVNYYTLSFILDGEDFYSTQMAYGSDIVAPDVPEKPGQTFAGWDDLPPTMPAHDVTVTGSYRVADGLESIGAAAGDTSASCYSISGVRLGSSARERGVYIVNGRKVLSGK